MNTLARKLPRVCLLAAAETSPSVLYSLYDVFSTAGLIYKEMTSGVPGDPVLEVQIVAATQEPFRCFGKVMVEPHRCIDEVEHTDVAIVCDMYAPITEPPRGLYRTEIEWLQRVHADGSILGSVCSGSLILAEAGLLDGLEASGHWAYREMFRDHYPRVKLREESILTVSGEQDSIVTAGGGDFVAGAGAVSDRKALRAPICSRSRQDFSAGWARGRAATFYRNDATAAA